MNCVVRAPAVLSADVSFQIPQRDGGCNHRREEKPILIAFRITRKARIQPNHQPKSQRWINPIRKATQLVEQQRLALKNCLLLIHIGRRCLPRWNPCVRSLRFPIFSAVDANIWHTRWTYKLHERGRSRSGGGGALSASRWWWWGRGRLGGGRRHKVGGQDGVAAEGRCVSSSSIGRSGKLWVSSSSQQSTQFERNGQFNTNAAP
jgi:hypothetical protein